MTGFDHTDPDEEHFGGIYRAVVVATNDPTGQGRIVTKVPALNGDADMEWAMPCIPMLVRHPLVTTTHDSGSVSPSNVDTMRLPKPGDVVWIMFEHGSIDFPVWMGTWNLSGGRA